MNQKERLILKTLQSDFPCTKSPYKVLARRLGLEEKSLILKIKKLKRQGFIRRIGAVVSSKHLAYKTALIGACIRKRNLSKAINFINRSRCVSHNYLRDSKYNVWFTFSAKTKKQIDDFIHALGRFKGIESILVLPAKAVFKINTKFSF